MNRINLILEQTQWAHKRTYTLLDQIPEKLWNILPKDIGSSISWQVGHIIISTYYNTIRVIVGSLEEAKEIFPIKYYAINFGIGSTPHNNEQCNPTRDLLLQQLKSINNLSLEVIKNLNESELDQPLVPSPMPHPIAHSKYEALMWDFQHEAWHSGQIALIRRALNNPLIFSDLRNKIIS